MIVTPELLTAAAALGLAVAGPPVAAAQDSASPYEDSRSHAEPSRDRPSRDRSSQDPDVSLRTEGSGEPIVVIGDLALEESRVRDAVRDIAMRGRSWDRPLARYQDPLCVTVLGFGEVLGERIAKRMRMQAEAVGAEVAESGCTPNATVAMVDRPAVLIERMRRERPGLIDIDSLRRVRAALHRGAPAVHWASEERRDRLGRAIARGNPTGALATDSLFDELLYPRDNRFPSRIEVPFSIARSQAMLVFDAYRLDNVHLDQIADYAVMHILGDPQPEPELGEDQPDSILNLFARDPLAAAPGLSLLDFAYLRGLYAMRPNEQGTRLERFTVDAYRELAEMGCAQAAPCAEGNGPG